MHVIQRLLRDEMPLTNLSPEVRSFCERLQRAKGGLKIMGEAAQGEFESYLSSFQERLTPAHERLAKAKKLAERIRDFMSGSDRQTKLQEAWCLIRFCLKDGLACDVRIIPKPMME